MCLSAVKLDHSSELFWDTPSWLSAWVSLVWAWRINLNKGVPTLFAYCEKLIWENFFEFNQGTCPWMAFAWIFFGIFLMIFMRGVCWANYLKGIYSISGSNISCSLATSVREKIYDLEENQRPVCGYRSSYLNERRRGRNGFTLYSSFSVYVLSSPHPPPTPPIA